MTICDRCGKNTTTHTMSIFNTDEICMDCDKKERAHPLYAKAKEVEAEHVRNGDYNFKGIGKPFDL
jgi:hypothetical protein